nr:hypothetical protein Q903MT_gene992 [Picea sitchensis]
MLYRSHAYKWIESRAEDFCFRILNRKRDTLFKLIKQASSPSNFGNRVNLRRQTSNSSRFPLGSEHTTQSREKSRLNRAKDFRPQYGRHLC